MVPVSVRTGAETDTFQNRVSALLADLATNEADPVKRLRRVQESMTSAKEDFKAIPAETLQDYTQFSPPAVAARAMRMYSRLRIADRMNPPFNLIISNVPGPTTPLYSAGARLRHFYPVSAITDGQGLNMTVQSYNGNLDFGFISCRELVPDLWTMADHLQASMQELLGAARAATGEAAPASPPTVAAKPSGTRTATRAKHAATKRAATDTTTPSAAGGGAPLDDQGRFGNAPGGAEAGGDTNAVTEEGGGTEVGDAEDGAAQGRCHTPAGTQASRGRRVSRQRPRAVRPRWPPPRRRRRRNGRRSAAPAASNGSPAAGSRTRVAAASAT